MQPGHRSSWTFYISLLWLEYKHPLGAPCVIGLDGTSTKCSYLAHSFTASAVPAVLLLTVFTDFFSGFLLLVLDNTPGVP